MKIRLFSIIRKEFIQIVRDKRTLAIILLIPIMQLFLLGYAATSDVRNIPLAVYDQCNCAESRTLLNAYRAADYFKLAYSVGSEDEIRSLIENGKARAAIIIPPDYNERLAKGDAQVAFILDGSDPTSASTAYSAAILIGQTQSTALLVENLQRAGLNTDKLQPPLEVRTQVWYNPDLVSNYFMIPGVIGMILFAITSILTATSVVRERERGTIEQLIVTPIRPWELVVGKVLPYVILAFIDTFEVLALGHWWFGGAHPGLAGADHRHFGAAAALGAWHRPVCLHHRQYAAGSHAVGLDDPAAFDISFRFLFSTGGHAESAAVVFGDHSAALLPGHHPFRYAQGLRLRIHLGRDAGLVCLWRDHLDRCLLAFSQAPGLTVHS